MLMVLPNLESGSNSILAHATLVAQTPSLGYTTIEAASRRKGFRPPHDIVGLERVHRQNVCSGVAILIAQNTPISGLRTEMGKKNGPKNGLWPQEKREKIAEKMGKWLFLPQFWANVAIFRPFFLLFPVGPRPEMS